MSNSEINYAENLFRKIWTTKGARLEAHKRLEKSNKYSNWGTALASMYVIVFSLQSIEQFTIINVTAAAINSTTIILSILIIIISLIENGNNNKSLSDLHHQCAKKLNVLYERMQQITNNYEIDSEAKKEIEGIGQKYQQIINDHYENHTEDDYYLFMFKEEKSNTIRYLFELNEDTKFFQYILNLLRLILLQIKISILFIKTYFIYIAIFIGPILAILYFYSRL